MNSKKCKKEMNSVWKNAKIVAIQARGLILTHQAGRYKEQGYIPNGMKKTAH
jgi:hypothetical protein